MSKGTFWFLLIVIFLALGGGLTYYLINLQFKQKLLELEKAKQAGPEVREIVIADKQEEKKASIFLKTETEEFGVNRPFSLDVMVKADNKKVDGAEFLLTFDPTLISLAEPVAGSFFTLYPQKVVDSEAGTVRVVAVQEPNQDKVLNEEILVSFIVMPLGRGEVTFDFDKSKTHIAGYGGQDLLGIISPLTIKIE